MPSILPILLRGVPTLAFLKVLLCLCFLQGYHSLDNGLALTPPMGWLSWQRFRCLVDCEKFPNECISEKLIKRIADKMASGGYLEVGYEYVIMDDCWSSKSRDSNNRLQADPKRFPSGIKSLADYVHKLGLKLGIFGNYGTLTCGGYPGSIEYLQLDAETFAEWGVDYLKFSACNSDEEGMEEGYARMAGYLNETGRPIAFSCSFPAYKGLKANYNMAKKHCNLWRNYDDIDDSWEGVKDIATWFADNQDFIRPYAGRGGWNDPDMLIIGNFGLSLEQSKSQMTIWSILAAPLIMSVDLDTIEPEFKEILLNIYAITINQDPLGIPGKLVSNTNEIMLWTKPLSGIKNNVRALAVGVVSNRTDGYYYPYDIQLTKLFDDQDDSIKVKIVKDVFDHKSHLNGKVYSISENITVRVPPSGAKLLILIPLIN